MRILHVANFSLFPSPRKRGDDIARYYSTDRKISNGLVRNGHCVWDFSYRDTARHLSPARLGKQWGAQKMNNALLTMARQFAPDIVLLGHCELLTAATLATLRDSLPACKIAQWWVDPFADSSLPPLRAKLPYLHAFFATSAPRYVASRLAITAPPPLYYLPNIVDSSVERERAFTLAAADYDYDMFFAGASAAERHDTLRRVAALPDTRCGFFGFDNRPYLGGAALAATIGKSKMGLNLSRAVNIPLYSSDRLAQLIGNGCLALTPRTPEMTRLFTDDEVVYYNNGGGSDDDDLLAHIKRYRDDDAKRRKIAENGWRRAHASYNEKRVTRFITEATLGAGFSEKYEWLYATATGA